MTPDLPALPMVTLVVAMRNERASIERCLSSIAAQDYPSGLLEVLVYDGLSTDGSLALAGGFASGRTGWAVRTNAGRIQAAAWNTGIRAARGEIVGIVSGHAELDTTYVRNAVDALARTRADLVGGPVRAVAEGAIAAAIASATRSSYGVGGTRHHGVTEPTFVDTVFMGLARRELWLRYPFDEEFVRNQDDELSYRLLDGGGLILCDPAIVSWYRSRSTFRDLWRQYFAYGYWKVRVLQAHPRQARLRHLAPVALVATVAGGVLLGVALPKVRAVSIVGLGLYGVTTAAAAAHYHDSKRPGSAPLLALAFAVVHFAYGTGMLLGIWRFRRSFARSWQAIGRGAPRPGREGVQQDPA